MALNEHAIHRNLNLLKPLHILHEGEGPLETKIWMTSEDIAASQQFLDDHEISVDDILVGIHAGSGDGWGMIHKRWPKEKYVSLGDRILSEVPAAKILLFGGSNEERLKAEIANLMSRRPIVVTNTSLRETAALIARCNVFVSNDSGLMHVASAVKTPTVGVFGPTDPLITAPYGKNHLVVAKDIECSPCWPADKLKRNKFSPKCKHDPPYACLTRLSVSEVFEATRSLI
jgi:ADP-heptose:LPS heptosyltransferase